MGTFTGEMTIVRTYCSLRFFQFTLATAAEFPSYKSA